MQYDRPVRELIPERSSVRTYAEEAMDPEAMRRMEEACASLAKAPFGEAARFRVVERPFERGMPVKVSDYGLVRNPRYFLIGAIERSPMAREGYGYLMEHLVLRATDLGLGTCWMGLFNREYFKDFTTRDDELVPAIAVLGVPAERRRLGERLIRMGVKADSRRDWSELFLSDAFGTPLSRESAGRLSGPLEMLRLAPSAGNTQPWRVVKEEGRNVLHVYLRQMKQTYYDAGMHNLDIGIAMSHLELAAREAGIHGEWRVSDPDLAGLPERTEYRASWHAR